MSSGGRTRVLLADDHQIMLDGLQEVLEGAGDYEVIGQAVDGVMLVELAMDLRPDLVIMELLLPFKHGFAACREITDSLPDTRVLVLTASNEENDVREALSAGATGFLQKSAGKERLLSTLRDVVAGEIRIPADVMRRMFAELRSVPAIGNFPAVSVLTTREQQILTLYCQGLSYAQIADATGRRPLTIRNSIYGIQRKLGTRSKQELVVWAALNGLVAL